MKFSTLFVGAFAALAAAQDVSSAASSALSGASSAASSAVSSATDRSSSASSTRSSSASAAQSASSSGAAATSASSSSSGSNSDSTTSSSDSVYTSTIYYQYPNTFHKPVSPTLLGSTVITATEGQSTSYSLPKGASTFQVTISNVTTTYTSTNTFHKPVSKSWLVTTTYEVCIKTGNLYKLLLPCIRSGSRCCFEAHLACKNPPWTAFASQTKHTCQAVLSCANSSVSRSILILLHRLPWVFPPLLHLRALLDASRLVLSAPSLLVPLLFCKKLLQ